MATRDGREIARHFSVVGRRSGLTRAEVTSGGHAHTCTSLDHRQVQPPWPDPEGSFPLSRLNLRCLKHCVITWGGGAAECFRVPKGAPLPSGRSPAVPASVSTAAEWRSCAEQQRPAAGSRLSPEEGLRLK